MPSYSRFYPNYPIFRLNEPLAPEVPQNPKYLKYNLTEPRVLYIDCVLLHLTTRVTWKRMISNKE